MKTSKDITLTDKQLEQLLHEEAFGTEWQASWNEDCSEFLDSSVMAESAQLAGFGKDAIDFILWVGQQIGADRNLTRLFCHCHYLLCKSKTFSRGGARQWQPLEDMLGAYAGGFFLHVALSGLPGAREFHQARGIPEKIAVDTYGDTSLWAEDYRQRHGIWGISAHILPWLFNHLSGELYRLERLQFIQRPFRSKILAFRNRLTKEVIVLSDAGVAYRADGELDGTGGEFDPKNGWTSRILREGNTVTGTPIHPKGIALKDEVSLSLDKWELSLSPGDPAVEIHIPAGSPMDFDACGDSFRLAIDFFPTYFPERPFKAFCCGSWILNTQFQDMLPSDSNMVRFQKEFYLYPILSSGRSGIPRIFGSDIQDLSKAPRDTTLRRAVLDHLESGGYLRAGGALLFPQDLDWGNQVYRKLYPQDLH